MARTCRWQTLPRLSVSGNRGWRTRWRSPGRFKVFFHARHAAAVVAEAVAGSRLRGQIIAIKQIGAAMVDADIGFAGGLGIITTDRRVAVNRIVLVRLDVT